jgi:hypothetical protein
MSKLLTFALILCVAGAAAAADLGNRPPVKVPYSGPANIPNPVLQGGDNLANAVVIPDLPSGAQYCDDGTTAGYVDDYTPTCPGYSDGDIAPDVVYSYTPATSGDVNFSLQYSGFDTVLYILDASGNEIACNDDYFLLQSFIDCIYLTANTTYYIVIDGFYDGFGSYHFCATSCETQVGCDLLCPPDAGLENEPPLVPNYVDNWNGGCNTAPNYPFQHIYGWCPPQLETIVCGVSGWYMFNGQLYLDTDWYTLCIGSTGCIVIEADAELPTYILELGPQDCNSVVVTQQATAGPCAPTTMTICGPPGSTVWFWVGPTSAGNPGEYDYVLRIRGLCCEVVSTEKSTWGEMKTLFR